MKREINFRAWDNECKVIREYDELKGLTLDALDASDFKLEQYTGLKDKSGKPIYEGDILQDLTDGYVVGTVEYNDGAFECAGYNMYDASDYKVNGNIHEDGDLIDH